MPGPVSDAHAKYEIDCNKCHGTFDKKIQSQLCLDCHEIIENDKTSATGLHGRMNKNLTTCDICHTEHKGRSADIMMLDPLNFDHTKTDFKLEGKHSIVVCDNCHLPKKKFREVKNTCDACHSNSDNHTTQLETKCNECHDERDWKESRYNHDKTKFILKGKHKKTSCTNCHPNDQYKKTPIKCYKCHVMDNKHAGIYGDKCEQCHTENEWKKTTFNHDRDTKHRLLGQHKEAKCTLCHQHNAYEEDTPTKCITCHKADDAHTSSYGDKCKSCHTPLGWKKVEFKHDKNNKVDSCIKCHRDGDIHMDLYGGKCGTCHGHEKWSTLKFDHTKDTKFELQGLHKKIDCDACHKTNPYKDKTENRCLTCHVDSDIHKGQEGDNCKRCHDERGWTKVVMFDHDLTQFPLLGMHAMAACEECHLSQQYKTISEICIECHDNEHDHNKVFGDECALCHNPNGWMLWQFDHNLQTDFSLTDRHENIKCEGCHISADNLKKNASCHECHKQNDKHRGQFGRKCEYCHSPVSWEYTHNNS
ncbi:cytochrome c3 family protein [Pseudomonadota bacterium]